MIELTDEMTGTHRVVTASGTAYLLDLDLRRATRLPRAEPTTDLPSADLRKDEQPVALLRILRCTVGRPLTLHLGEVDDYVGYGGTIRMATEVMSITAA